MDKVAANHYYGIAREAAMERDNWTCRKCGKANRPHHTHGLETNHIVPRVGRGYQAGCHNHISNLETLCRPCHAQVTKAQRKGSEPPEPTSNPDAPMLFEVSNATA